MDYINQSQVNMSDQHAVLSLQNINSSILDINNYKETDYLGNMSLKKSFDVFKYYLNGDFGVSLYKHQKVIDIILEKSLFSLKFSFIYFIFLFFFSVLLSVISIIYYQKSIYKIINILSVFFNNIPTYVLAISFIFFFSDGGVLPLFNIKNTNEIQNITHISSYNYYVLPIFLILLSGVSRMSLMFTQSLKTESQKNYVSQAYLKSLSRKEVIIKHMLKNRIIIFAPYLLKHFIDMLFSSAFIIEIIFSLDGLASLSFEAAITRDYPLIIGSLLFYSFIALLFNFFADLVVINSDKAVKM